MLQTEAVPTDLRVLSEHIYQYKKGVRNMVLYTFPERYQQQAIGKLERQGIDYLIQPVGNRRINLFFGRKECMDALAVHSINSRPKRTSFSAHCSVMTYAVSANAIANARPKRLVYFKRL